MGLNQVDALAETEKANQDRLKKEYSGKADTRFVTDVRKSLLFQYNWADLLSAAPTALSLLGACHVASSSKEAAAISLGSVMPPGGWKYLPVSPEPTLEACLAYVGDCGVKTLSTVANNMDSIAGTAGDLSEIVTEVVRSIQKLPDPVYFRILDNKLNQLRRLSESCLKYADETERAFDTWLLYVTEFHLACLQKQGLTEAVAEANHSLKLQAEIEAPHAQEAIESAESALRRSEQMLKETEAAYQKARSDIPSAWEACAMSAINDIRQSVPSNVSQAFPAVIKGINPTATLLQLKHLISKLRSFFGALSTMVQMVIQNKVKKFDEDLDGLASDAAKNQILHLTDMDIEIIYGSTLHIKAYSELLQTITRMYSKMHVEHISNGIDLIWDLRKVLKDESQVREKRNKLNDWAEAASKEITKTIGDKKYEIRDELNERIDSLAEQIQMLERVGVPKPDLVYGVAKNVPQVLTVNLDEI